MRKKLASIVAAASLFASTLAFADDLKVGDKMPKIGEMAPAKGVLEEYITPKDELLKKYIGYRMIPKEDFKSVTTAHSRPNDPPYVFDFKMDVYSSDGNIYKTFIVRPNAKSRGKFTVYVSCYGRKEIDVVKGNFYFRFDDSAVLLNVPELSCNDVIISDIFKEKTESKDLTSYVFKSGE